MTEKMSEKEKFKLKKLIKELEAIRGRHTELVTVHIPAEYSFNDIVNMLRTEQSTAENIKSKAVRKNVTAAIDKIIRNLQLYKRPPANGLSVFCGNVSQSEGDADIQFWAIEPPDELNTKLYWCSQRFDVTPLMEMVEEREIYGILCMDRQEADVALVFGKKVKSLVHMESIVPGKTRAGGQCLIPNTLVQSIEGDIFEIEKSHNPQALLAADIANNSTKNTAVTDKWNTKKDQVYRIETKYPRLEVQCSRDHIFFINFNGSIIEKPAEDLKHGDCLIMPESIKVTGKEVHFNTLKYHNSFKISKEGIEILKNKRTEKKLHQKELAKTIGVTQTAISLIELGKRDVRANFLKRICDKLDIDFHQFIINHTKSTHNLILPVVLDKELAQITGYFLGDGNFENERVCFSEQRKAVAEYYNDLLSSYFNACSTMKFREDKNYWQIRVYGKPLVKFMKEEFPELRNSSKSSIPKKILESKNEIVASFLRGLFDAEGFAINKRGLGLGMNNKKIIQQLQMLLLRFSIISSINEYDNRANPYSDNPRFIINLTEKKSLELFKQYIGFSSTEKTKILESVIKNKTDKSEVRQIFVSGSKVREIIEKRGYKISMFPKVSDFLRGKRMMSKQAFFKSILKVVEKKDQKLYEELKKIHDYQLLPVQISKIEKIQVETKMIDISTQEGNFIANGLLVHNSSQRFSRVREGLMHDWYKQIAEAANRVFAEHKDVIGILISGTGPTKEDFLREELLHAEVRKKILGTVDTSYTGDYGLEETLQRGQDLIKESSITKEKNLLLSFLTELQKPSGLAVYGLEETVNAMNKGAISAILVSDSTKYRHFEFECGCNSSSLNTLPEMIPKVCKSCNQTIKITRDIEIADFLEELANNYGTKYTLVSADTREGQQFLALGGVGGFLRYRTM
ncbi:MAG: helix-turn-helix domain-containing protein [Candidatus Aenigmarchaeota archaeon]|nr:helix-turn-helix domain-containing protein [Candidatus Aenigmarchaeota archaeon]